MPQLACNPILINLEGLNANAFENASILIENYAPATISKRISIKLRTNAKGEVKDFDISPLVAGVCRQHFNGDKEDYASNYNKGTNTWSVWITYQDKTTSQSKTVKIDNFLFGAGAVEEADLLAPYLLRRNTSTIHIYEGLPGTFAQCLTMDMMLFSDNLIFVRRLYGASSGLATVFPFDKLDVKPDKYYLVGASSVKDTVWKDAQIWNDHEVWQDTHVEALAKAVIYPLHIHPSPADCIRGGAKIYVRYWNSRGTWSYALLDVLYNDLKAKTEYADSWRLNAKPVNGRILGDRVQTDKVMTYSITAGRDGLNRLDVDELRDMQRAYCVQVWDVDQEVWRDCYVQDATTRNSGGSAQEMTFTLEMPHEYTFTR